MRVLLIDNRDSFTQNLAQAFLELKAKVETVSVKEVIKHLDSLGNFFNGEMLQPGSLICIGPGPRAPDAFPVLDVIIQEWAGRIPIFGVCLGMQALAKAYGGELALAKEPVHGKPSSVHHDGSILFEGLPSPMRAMRYNSIIVETVPDNFMVRAKDEHGQVMAFEDRERKMMGVQFHPESIGTEGGLILLNNMMGMIGGRVSTVNHRPGGIPPPQKAAG